MDGPRGGAPPLGGGLGGGQPWGERGDGKGMVLELMMVLLVVEMDFEEGMKGG